MQSGFAEGSRQARAPSAHITDLTAAVQALVDASLAADAGRAAAAISAIEHRVREVAERTDVPLTTSVAVFVRDCWTCRYCGATTIAPPVLRALSRLYPEQFPYHPNWKAGQVHPAYMLVSTSLDHLVAGARDGSWTDPNNLMTACSPCNTAKSDLTLDELGWTLIDEAAIRSDWDGLTGHYRALWDRAGQPDAAYHRRWQRALDRA